MSRTRGSAVPGRAEAEPTRVAPGCPKCGAPRAAEACPRCGLVYDRWHGPMRDVSTDRLDTERLWREAAQDFLAPPQHAVFIAHCMHAGELPYAVARYAEESRHADPERARIARERRRQVAALAEVMWLTPARSAQSHDGVLRRLLRLIGGAGVIMLFFWTALAVGWTTVARSAAPAERASAVSFPPATTRIATPTATAALAGDHAASSPTAGLAAGMRP